MGRYGSSSVVCVVGKGIVELVEQGVLSGEILERQLHSILDEPLRTKTDFIVLGCTHYPFIREAIANVAGSSVNIIDGVEGTVRQLHRVLEERNLLNPLDRKGSRSALLLSSGGDKSILLMKLLLGEPLPAGECASIDV
jgi:glutamate racemase